MVLFSLLQKQIYLQAQFRALVSLNIVSEESLYCFRQGCGIYDLSDMVELLFPNSASLQ